MKAFISYTHTDEKYLKRLQVHLTQMKREALLESWTDNEISAGENLSERIESNLNDSEIFIALLSPDYIASNYCYEKEFQTALKKLEKKEIIIVPIICEPCDWLNTPFRNLLAIPKDGKPISMWSNENTAYISVIESLRKLVKGFDLGNDSTDSLISTNSPKKNYKIQKDFDSIQKLEFVEESFSKIVSFLKEYLDEISGLENISTRILKEGESQFKFILVNRNMIKREATLVLEFNKDLDPMYQRIGAIYMGSEKEFSLKVSINNSSYDFDLSHDEYNLFWKINGINIRFESKKYDTKEIATTILDDVLKAVGISIEE